MECLEAFIEARDQLLERLDWVEIAAQKDRRDLTVVVAGKAELDAFIAQFRKHSGIAKIATALEQLEAISAAAGRQLDDARLINLFELVVERAHWMQAERDLPVRILVNRVMASAPPDFRAAVMANYAKDGHPVEYDAVAQYRASEADCDKT